MCLSLTTPNPTNCPPSISAESRRRNRVAATRSRAKAQAAIAQLEAAEQCKRLENQQLLSVKEQLRNEILFLRHEILRHAICDCPMIQNYIAKRAWKLANGER